MTSNHDNYNNHDKKNSSELKPQSAKSKLHKPKSVHDLKTKPLKQPDLFASQSLPVTNQKDQALQQLSVSSQTLRATPKRLTAKQEASLVRYNHLSYLLYALSLFSAGLLWILPVVMNYTRRRQADHTWLATHFDWQIKTFWYSLLLVYGGLFIALLGLGGLGIGIFAESSGVAISSVLMSVVGTAMFLFSFIWYIYRIVRGWIALTDHRPVP